jgi:hypothetical protein
VLHSSKNKTGQIEGKNGNKSERKTGVSVKPSEKNNCSEAEGKDRLWTVR